MIEVMKEWLLAGIGPILAVIAGILLACLLANAGMPNSCPVPGHKGPPCEMAKCAAMNKDGTKTGANCSKYCAKSCCLCSDACPKESNQSPDQGEEWLRMGFGD